MEKFVFEGKVIFGSNVGEKVFILRLSLSPFNINIPFKFQRRQFPLSVFFFAMIINKSQGQSLKNVGIYSSNPMFSHGQLYVAISKVTLRDGLKILMTDEDGDNIPLRPQMTFIKKYFVMYNDECKSLTIIRLRYIINMLSLLYNIHV